MVDDRAPAAVGLTVAVKKEHGAIDVKKVVARGALFGGNCFWKKCLSQSGVNVFQDAAKHVSLLFCEHVVEPFYTFVCVW